MKKFGIDISHWQGAFDLSAAKAEGVEFVIVKGGGGDAGLYVDSRFDRNYKEAKKLGLPVGCYWFSKATSVAEAQREADYFITNVLKGRQFELPVYMDVETSDQARLGKQALTDVVLAWLRAVQSAGYWVGLYSYHAYINTYLEDERLQGFAHWVAEWSTKCHYTGNEGVFGMWQFGGETNKIRSNKINGQTVDQNYLLIDYEPMIKAAGLNGFAKQAAAPAKKSEAEIAKEVLAGKWGNGTERKQRLEAAGYNFARIQTAVNELVSGKTAKKSNAEIAKEVIRGDWGNGAERKQRLVLAGYDYAAVQKLVDEILG